MRLRRSFANVAIVFTIKLRVGFEIVANSNHFGLMTKMELRELTSKLGTTLLLKVEKTLVDQRSLGRFE